MANDYPFIMMPVSIFSENLSAADYKVFGTLASYTRADRVCHVFANTIAAKAGLNRASVFRSLSKLEQLGYIRRQNDVNKGLSANYYYIDFNPLPSRENATRVVSKMQLGSRENATQEVDLKEVYLNSKNLKTRTREKSKEVIEEKPEIETKDRQIVEFIANHYQDVYLWATVIKTNTGLAIRPISRLGEKNINLRLPELVADIKSEFGAPLAILPANSNVLKSVEVV